MPNDQSMERPPSRSQLRRDALAVLEIAKKLVSLTDAQLTKLDLPVPVYDLIKDTQVIKQQIAHKRQLHYLAKRLRQADVDVQKIHNLLAMDQMTHYQQTIHLHLAEQWRDQLISQQDTGLTAFMENFPNADRQQLRQLMRQVQHEQKMSKPPKSARLLFKLITDVVKENTL